MALPATCWGSGMGTPRAELTGLDVFAVGLSRAGRGPSLLKAFPTVNRSPLSRLKGNGRFFPTLGAGGRSFCPIVALTAPGLTPLHLTSLATFGFVLEPLVGEEKLLPGGEYELRSAVHTLQDPIPVLHKRTPPCSDRAPPARNYVVVLHRKASYVTTLSLLPDP